MNFRNPFQFQAEYKAKIFHARYVANGGAGVTLPDGFTRRAENALMISSKSNNFHSTRDKYYLWAGDGIARDFARINCKTPGSNDGVEIGTLTFDSLGFKGNGSDGCINIGSLSGLSNFTQNLGSLSLHVTSFDAASNSAVYGLRNAAGTAQVTAIVRSAAVSDTTRSIINANTNGDHASSVMTRGTYFFIRSSSTVQFGLRRTLSSGTQAITSIAIPSGDLYAFARNSLSTSTVDLFSSARIGMLAIGGVLSTDDRTRWLNSYIDYFHIVQKPYVFATAVRNSIGTIVSVLYEATGSGWDGGSIFGAARYRNGSDDFELYGGTTDTGSDPDNYSVGAFDFTTPISGSKDTTDYGSGAGIIIDIADHPTLTALFPMDCLIIGTDVYWFFSARVDDGNSTHDTYIGQSTTSDPKNITNIQPLITSGGTGHFNHGFRIVRNHPDTTYWYAVYAHRNTSSSAFQINSIRCLRANDITNGANWSVVDTNIVATPSNVGAVANMQPVYPFAWYNSTSSEYHLLHGRFFDEKKSDAFTIFWKKSSTLNSFPVGLEIIWPTGSLTPGAQDAGYTSLPYMDFDNSLIFYSGRNGGAASPYIARLVKQYYLRD